MDLKYQRIIIYGIGTLFVALWAVFGVLPYFVAMVMASGTLAIALSLEAKDAQIHHDMRTYYKKMTFAIIIIILCVVLIMFNYE